MDTAAARAETQTAIELLHSRILSEKAAAEKAVTKSTWKLTAWIAGCFH
jgi:hypothetical protein